ncbi:MAG: glycosyltransferase family 9 protein [Tepidisphaeraceae bacterium]
MNTNATARNLRRRWRKSVRSIGKEQRTTPGMGSGQLKVRLKRLLYAPITGVAGTPPTRFKKLCIYKRDGIGDFILAISAIRLLVREVGAQNTVLVTWPQAADFAAAEFPDVERVVLEMTDPTRMVQRARVLRNQRARLAQYAFDRLISLRHLRGDDDELALGWIRTQESLGVVCEGAFERSPDTRIHCFRFSRPIVRSVAPVPDTSDGVCEDFRNHQALVSSALGRSVGVEEILPVVTSLSPASENYAVVAALPGVFPFAGAPSNSIRNIPFNLLEAGIREMRRHSIDGVYLCGSRFQRAALEELARELSAVDLKVKVSTPASFHEFAVLLSKARCVLSSETGAAHLAVALDKPSVMLIGGGHYGHYAPWTKSPRQIWLTNRVPCFGCNWSCIYPKPICITDIDPSAVTQAIDRVLGVPVQ